MENVILLDKCLEAEHAVLGSLLIDPDIAPQLFATVKADDFLHDVNRAVFLAARDLFRDGSPVDAVTIRNHMAQSKAAENADLSAYFVQLMEITPTSANWLEYAKIMRDQAALARVRDCAAKIAAATSLDDCRPLAAQFDAELEQRQNVRVKSLNALMVDFLNYQGECAEKPRNDYVSYGFRELDAGMFTQLGDVVVIGGYPSDGKTAFSLPLAYTIANAPRRDGDGTHKVGYFSLETNFEKLRDRMMTHLSQVDFAKIKFHNLSDGDWETLFRTVAEVGRNPAGDARKQTLRFVEAAGMSASDIISVSRAYGFDVIFVDYVQIITPETSRNSTRAEEVAAISRQLHAFAQKTKTLVFLLSQLTRPDSASAGKNARNPRMNNLKESGQLEQDADAIFIIFRPDQDSERRILRVAKNKEGRLGNWFLDFDAATQTFRMSTNQNAANAMRGLADAGRAAKQRNRIDADETRMAALENPDDSELQYQLPF